MHEEKMDKDKTKKRKINLPHKSGSLIDYDYWMRNSLPSAEVSGREIYPYGRMEHLPRVRVYLGW